VAGYSVTFSVVDDATKQIDAINRRIAAMRAPMERLSKQVTRFVDVSGLGKVAKSFEWIASAASSVLRTLVEIVPVLGAITGAATIAGMVKLVSTYAGWSQELEKSASNLGITTQQLQRFEDATRLAGGNVADMDAGLKSLHDTAAAVARGQGDAGAIGWFNRLGIKVNDANGHLRSMADLMPEVVQKIGEIKNPADRAAASAALLGDANNNLVETFRRSHQSFSQWLTDAGRYTELSDQQKGQLQAFAEAQGHLSTAFDHLGQQISATLAKNLTPFMDKLATFVDTHQTEIIAAVDRISKAFADWLGSIKWDDVEAGITKVIDGLTWISNHLGEIKVAAEVVAGVFAFKWAVGIVAAIAQVTTALGTAGGVAGAVAGTGLMGALAGIAAIVGTLAIGSHYETPATQREREQHRKDMGTAPPSNMPTYDTWTDSQGRKHDATTGAILPQGAAEPPAPGATGSLKDALGITPAQFDAFRSSVAKIEHADYGQMGGSSGRFAGKYQMGADEIRETAAHLGVQAPSQTEFLTNPGMQEKFFEQYTLDHHNYLMAHNAKYAAMSPEDKAAALAYAHNQGAAGASHWIDTGMEGKDAFGTSGAAYSKGVHSAFAQLPTPPVPPAQVPVATAATINGSVKVDVTHRNPPPDSSITATGSGSVNVAPPRVERQQLADI
jgi:hypothetical protein